MSKYILGVLGILTGLFGYQLFFLGVDYNPQVFFNSAILLMNCLILFRLDKVLKDEKSVLLSFFIMSVVIGVIASYFIKSLV